MPGVLGAGPIDNSTAAIQLRANHITAKLWQRFAFSACLQLTRRSPREVGFPQRGFASKVREGLPHERRGATPIGRAPQARAIR